MSLVVYKSLDFLGYPNHRIGSDGFVSCRVNRKGRPLGYWRRLKGFNPKYNSGYVLIPLSFQGKSDRFHAHVLALLSFVGPCPPGMECRHLDGIKTNNARTNLCWGTPRENWDDKVRHGTAPIGERNRNAKLTEDQVREVKDRKLTWKGSERRLAIRLAYKFGVSPNTVRSILQGRWWKHV